LRTGDDQNAKQILDRLAERFGDKNERVMAYRGMWEEANATNEKELKQVLELYGKVMEADPANIVCSARHASEANRWFSRFKRGE
jgi:hypothetical protein